MKQTYKPVPRRDLLHYLHGELIVVGGYVGGGIDRCKLVLGGGNLVVLGFGKDSKLPKLLVEICHVGGNLGLDNAEIVIVQLLTLGRLRAE